MATPEMKAGDRTLSRAAGMVATAKSDFDRLSATLSDNLVAQQAKWQGQGGRAFTNLHQAWTEKQNRIVQALNEFEASLHLDRAGQHQHRPGAVGLHGQEPQPSRRRDPDLTDDRTKETQT